jgi:heme/copper-type cytochrome/quinol oxidase subunit 4
MPDESVHSTQKVVLGFILGLILSAICFVIAVVVGMTLGSRHSWVFPLLNAIALILVSLYALSKYNESGIARGTVIALSLVFLVNAICGIGWMH